MANKTLAAWQAMVDEAVRAGGGTMLEMLYEQAPAKIQRELCQYGRSQMQQAKEVQIRKLCAGGQNEAALLVAGGDKYLISFYTGEWMRYQVAKEVREHVLVFKDMLKTTGTDVEVTQKSDREITFRGQTIDIQYDAPWPNSISGWKIVKARIQIHQTLEPWRLGEFEMVYKIATDYMKEVDDALGLVYAEVEAAWELNRE